MTRLMITLAFGAMLAVSPAGANAKLTAHVVGPQGNVLINAGEGYVPATAQMPLQPGDKVFVGEGGSVVLGFAGCSLSLPQMTTYAIPAVEPCNPKLAGAPAGSVHIEPVFGSGGFGGVDPQALAVTGAVITMIGVVAFLAAGYDEPDQLTPNGNP